MTWTACCKRTPLTTDDLETTFFSASSALVCKRYLSKPSNKMYNPEYNQQTAIGTKVPSNSSDIPKAMKVSVFDMQIYLKPVVTATQIKFNQINKKKTQLIRNQ